LPDYMIPPAIMMVDAIPRTPNGKVDRRALPAPDADRLDPESKFVVPRTPVEEELANICTELLRAPRVSVEENFFKLGGNSLVATQLILRVREKFNVELPIYSIFETPTIAGLAQRIEMARSTTY